MEKLLKKIRDLYLSKEISVKDAADKILTEYNYKDNLPVPIVDIMKKLSFKVYEQVFSDEDLCGFIAIDHELEHDFGTDKLVVVDRRDNPGHQRFTMAHELCHYIFDFDRTKETAYYSAYRKSTCEEAEEKNANEFARNLLMPADSFRAKYEYYSKKNIDLYDMVNQLSDDFGVSATAIKRRFEELKITYVGN